MGLWRLLNSREDVGRGPWFWLAFVALVERSRANLALLRYRLMESERHPV